MLYGKMLHGQMLHGQMLHGQMLHGQMLHGQMLHGQMVLGHFSTVKDGSTNLKCRPWYFPWSIRESPSKRLDRGVEYRVFLFKCNPYVARAQKQLTVSLQVY